MKHLTESQTLEIPVLKPFVVSNLGQVHLLHYTLHVPVMPRHSILIIVINEDVNLVTWLVLLHCD